MHQGQRLKILFLDFDGVLSIEAYQRAVGSTLSDADYVTRSSKLIDPAAVARLNRVLSATGAQVVVSSTWRIGMTVPELQALLAEVGFAGVVCGMAPRLHVERGTEIRAWLDEHAPDASFVILDDGEAFGDLEPRVVRTDPAIGLSDADCERAVALLSA